MLPAAKETFTLLEAKRFQRLAFLFDFFFELETGIVSVASLLYLCSC